MSFRLSTGWATSGLCPHPELSLRSSSARSGPSPPALSTPPALLRLGYISPSSCRGRLVNSQDYAGALNFRFAQVGRAWRTSPTARSTIEAFALLRASRGYVSYVTAFALLKASTATSATSGRPRLRQELRREMDLLARCQEVNEAKFE